MSTTFCKRKGLRNLKSKLKTTLNGWFKYNKKVVYRQFSLSFSITGNKKCAFKEELILGKSLVLTHLSWRVKSCKGCRITSPERDGAYLTMDEKFRSSYPETNSQICLPLEVRKIKNLFDIFILNFTFSPRSLTVPEMLSFKLLSAKKHKVWIEESCFPIYGSGLTMLSMRQVAYRRSKGSAANRSSRNQPRVKTILE